MRREVLVNLSIVMVMFCGTANAQPAQATVPKVLASVEGRWEQMFCDLTDARVGKDETNRPQHQP